MTNLCVWAVVTIATVVVVVQTEEFQIIILTHDDPCALNQPSTRERVRHASPKRGTHINVYLPWVDTKTGADWHVLLVSIWPEVIFESWLLRAALWDEIALCCRLGWLRSDVGFPWNYPHAETGTRHNNKHIWTRGASGICLGAGWNYDSCCDGIRSAVDNIWPSHSRNHPI